jgi:hypothetical protein
MGWVPKIAWTATCVCVYAVMMGSYLNLFSISWARQLDCTHFLTEGLFAAGARISMFSTHHMSLIARTG